MSLCSKGIYVKFFSNEILTFDSCVIFKSLQIKISLEEIAFLTRSKKNFILPDFPKKKAPL